MISKYMAAALLATALMTSVASAQNAAPKADANATSTAPTHKDGEWRASKLVGLNVYNQANEKIGDINEVILDKSGKVAKVILGVGGFLGMGEHDVAVAFDKLKWVNEPVRSTAASNSTAPAERPATSPDNSARTASDGTPRTTTGAASSTSGARNANEKWYPDHAVYNATKEQLKEMPQFNY
jgi:sporulation protein YlmC with PRC-barrel domain